MPKAKKLPSGNYRVQVYIGKENGKNKYESFTAETAKEAEFMALDFSLNKKKRKSKASLTLTEAIDQYIESRSNIFSPSTIRGYRHIQKNALSLIINLPISKLEENIVQEQININAKKYSAKSIKNQYGLVSVVLRGYKIIFDNIVLKPREKTMIKPPDIDQIIKIMEIIKGDPYELQFLCALWLGLRQSEIAALKWENFTGNTMIIKGAKVYDEHDLLVERTRNKSYAGTRELQLPKHMIEKLKTIQKKQGFIFETKPSQIYKRFQKILKDNGLPHFRVHDLRHANASIMLYLNIPDKYAMERLGQNTPHMLKNTYQHTFNKEKVTVDEKVNAFFESQLSHEISHDAK